ncbi:farnesyl-diphosphate farnesyltransferase [Sphaeroforma arctica JP610]|uniref:Squalene synthase n=1 Tax=Sphaeroforma arctica JP610 TaxID=667725 RepID=A0A0L0G855_9EUKA|nr:farnesyl-diphosphate farnesyltransferase [Sphaeroforma arctica JP610]KNC85079.1 farnesyl-diphosphate farnesyltransferase [Sphaeroforma arctica JP610]|eukprot:XP_014158981.1 farnesyl-diphosphate farnesyltransferase [Sphaeroforma arctica JP610]
MQFVASLSHVDEIFAMVSYKLNGGISAPTTPTSSTGDLSKADTIQKETTKELIECYRLLGLTSRSFAAVIQALQPELRAAVCVFYLVLRGLDTIEDDMTIPFDTKAPLLLDFHNILYKEGWTFDGNGPDEKDRHLLLEFHYVVTEFLRLKKEYRDVIQNITQRMAKGMCHYADESITVITLADWDEYCHHVAGLVGIGLSKLFAASGLESEEFYGKECEHLGNQMGLFLQKTNIIRDFLEDLDEGRVWWPKCVWGKYAASLEEFRLPENRGKAVACMNELITNALEHIPAMFTYMSKITEQSVFNFCAIPQVMAVATLNSCYNNPRVFQKVVKIRKGLAVRYMLDSKNMDAVALIFDEQLKELETKMNPSDPSYKATTLAVHNARRLVKESGAEERLPWFTWKHNALTVRPYPHGVALVAAGTLGYLVYKAK